MAYETILLETNDAAVAVLTLNRPESHNALNLQMVEEIHDVLGRFETSDEAKALVVTAAGGKAFMSGADIAELRERRRPDAWKGINTTLFSRLESFPHPTVAAIEGWCMGGGCELVTACDFRVAGATSRFGQPEVRDEEWPHVLEPPLREREREGRGRQDVARVTQSRRQVE